VQVHHVDENPGKNTFENLAVLCLECHNQTQLSGGFGRKLNATLVIKYRDEWLQRVSERRDAADRAAVEKMTGFSVVSSKGSVEQVSYSEGRADAILAYIQSLPELRLELWRRAKTGWNTGVTETSAVACYDYIDKLQGVLVTLAGFYPRGPRGNFGEDPHRFFAQVIASRFRWHRAHSEPHGPGSGGTIVNVICSRNVIDDVEKMIENMVQSLVGYDDRFDWRAWPSRWRADLTSQTQP
jgi:hypothetical protein